MTPLQLKALETFRRTCDDARGVLERVEGAAYNRYSAANRRSLAETGQPDAAAFQAYAATCAGASESYWRTVQDAADQCARAMTEST